MQRKTKYRAKKVVVDGIKFDSKKEAKRWQELQILQTMGKIKGLRRQVKFDLIPDQRETPTETYSRGAKKGQYKPGKVIERGIAYYADFVYQERFEGGWRQVVEDTKGMKTPDYIIKRKLMLYQHGIRIREI